MVSSMVSRAFSSFISFKTWFEDLSTSANSMSSWSVFMLLICWSTSVILLVSFLFRVSLRIFFLRKYSHSTFLPFFFSARALARNSLLWWSSFVFLEMRVSRQILSLFGYSFHFTYIKGIMVKLVVSTCIKRFPGYPNRRIFRHVACPMKHDPWQ